MVKETVRGRAFLLQDLAERIFVARKVVRGSSEVSEAGSRVEIEAGPSGSKDVEDVDDEDNGRESVGKSDKGKANEELVEDVGDVRGKGKEA
jgi:hypothetical protein